MTKKHVTDCAVGISAAGCEFLAAVFLLTIDVLDPSSPEIANSAVSINSANTFGKASAQLARARPNRPVPGIGIHCH